MAPRKRKVDLRTKLIGPLMGPAAVLALVYFLLSTPAGRTVVIIVVVIAIGMASLFIFAKIKISRKEMARVRALRISDIDSMSGYEFEEYVAALLTSKGFQTSVTKGSGDSGVDVIAEKGSIRYAIQCKRYSQPVSRRAVSDAVAGIAHYGCTKAMVVTNAGFTKGANALAKSNNCILVDRDMLATWVSEWQNQQLRW